MRDRSLPTTVSEPRPPHEPAPGPAVRPRRWPPVAFVAAFWALALVVGRLEKPYFIGFLYGMASVAVLGLCFLAWWAANRRVRLADRLGGLALVAGGCGAVGPLVHPSLGWFGLLTTGLPVVLTACTAWLLLARKLPAAWVRPGLAVVVLLAWGYFALLRVDGLDSGLHATVRWRWTPSAEDLFVSEHRAGAGVDTTPAAASAWVPSPGPDDWTGFRGPERDGVLRGVRIATDWEANPPRLRWRQRVGPAWSSLVVLGDRLFTQEQRG